MVLASITVILFYLSLYVAPSFSRVLALEVMLDGIGEHVSLAIAILYCCEPITTVSEP